MAYAALCLVFYTLCLNSFAVAFPANGFVTDWRHLRSGLAEFRNSRNVDWRTDGSQPLGTKYKVFVDDNYDVILPEADHLATSDSKLENSEKIMPMKDDKKIKNKHKMRHHIFPMLVDNSKVVGTTHLRSQKPQYTSTLSHSLGHDGEEDVKPVYGVLRILFPFRLKKHTEENGTSSQDDDSDSAAPYDDQSVATKILDLQTPKYRSLRKKRDNWHDENETMWKRLLYEDTEEEVQKYVFDECEMCNSPVMKEKRDTGILSVETTTSSGKANVTNNLKETSERSENNTDDSNKKPISRLLDIQMTTSQPSSTTSKHSERNIEDNQEEPRAATETSLKTTNVTSTEVTGAPMGVEDDFAYIVDPQEIYLGPDKDTASGRLETARGKIITLHWTIKFEPKANSSGSGEHPHPPADDGRDVFEQVIYLDPDSDDSTEDVDTTDVQKHTESGEDNSEFVVQLPLPFGTTQEFGDLETSEVPSVGQNEITDTATATVVELFPQKPITEPSEDWFKPQDVLVYPLDQPASSIELINGLGDSEPEFPASIPSLQDEEVDMATEGEDYELHESLIEPVDTETESAYFDPETLTDISSVLEPVDTETESAYFDPETLTDIPSVLEPVDTETESAYFDPETLTDIPSVLEVAVIPTAPDVELISQQQSVDSTEDWFTPQDALLTPVDQVSADHEVVEGLVDVEPGLAESIPSMEEELVVMETTDELNVADALLSTPSPLHEPADMVIESTYVDPYKTPDVLPTLEVVDTPAAPDMDLLLQEPLTEAPEDWFTPQEELVHPLEEPSSEIVLVDSEVDLEPGIPESIPSLQDEVAHIETAGVDYNPDTSLSTAPSLDEPAGMESESGLFPTDASIDIPTVLEVKPDMQLFLQEALKETPEVLVTPQDVLLNPLDQPSVDNVLIGGSVGMESEIPESNPLLQDEQLYKESVSENHDPDALLTIASSLEELVDIDPNTVADILSTVAAADVQTTGLAEMLVDALAGEQSEPTILPSLDEPVAVQPELSVSLVEASTDKQFEYDTLTNIQSAVNEPEAFSTTTLPIYDEYGLENYGEEAHGDHIDHTEEPCVCRRSNIPDINHRP